MALFGPAKTCSEDAIFFVNDFSTVNETCMYKIVEPENIEQLQANFKEAIELKKQFEQESGRTFKISISGSKHSMAGQTITEGGYQISMAKFNEILDLDKSNKIISVQSGVIWKDIQEYIDEHGLSVDVMQDYNIFTVGGSISVNAIGWNTDSASLASTIQEITLLNPSGEIVKLNKKDPLFGAVIGGYGLFGVILEAKIKLIDNINYKSSTDLINYTEFPKYFKEKVAANGNKEIMNAFLALNYDKNEKDEEISFLKKMAVIRYRPDLVPEAEKKPFKELDNTLDKMINDPTGFKFSAYRTIQQLALTKISNNPKKANAARSLVWNALKNSAIKEVVSRNTMMNKSKFLDLRSDDHNMIIKIYLVPKTKFVAFIDDLRKVATDQGAPLVYASVLNLNKNDTSMMSVAPTEDMFVVNLVLIQKKAHLDAQAEEKMRNFGSSMIDKALSHGGRVYMAHRHHFNAEQLVRGYPNTKKFFELKRQYDPDEVFSNQFFETYSQEIK